LTDHQDNTYSWLALSLIPGLGNILLRRLLDEFGSPEAVFGVGFSELIKIKGVREAVARKIIKRQFVSDPEKELRKLEELNARVITFFDFTYPPFLKEIYNPPMTLFTRGKEISSQQIFISVVGSRNPTHYGQQVAEEISAGLARRGIGVVSGLARGVDSAAHWGCLRNNGFTIAVIGTGIDLVYPAINNKLFERIIESGAVITEFPLGTPPEARNFPIRNRIISGLGRGVLVVEAARKSGSLITASFALDQGREVFAVPGSIHSFKSTGTHFLIKQGAKLVENAEDILNDLGFGYGPLQKGGSVNDTSTVTGNLNAGEKKIYDIIGDYPMHIDQIVRAGDMDSGMVLSVLMKMELEGLIKQLPGKMFVR